MQAYIYYVKLVLQMAKRVEKVINMSMAGDRTRKATTEGRFQNALQSPTAN